MQDVVAIIKNKNVPKIVVIRIAGKIEKLFQ
jgi:hypothetical protein